MIRLRVLIYNEDHAELKRLSKMDKITMALQVRRAVHSYVKHRKTYESDNRSENHE